MSSKLQVITITLLSFSIFLSCKKENKKRWTEVNLATVDAFSGDEITGIDCNFLIMQSYLTAFTFTGSEIEIIHDTTLSTSSYSYGFLPKASENYTYECRISPFESQTFSADQGDYIEVLIPYQTFLSEKGETYNVNFKVSKFGMLKYDITNTNCFDQYDRLECAFNHNVLPEVDQAFKLLGAGCFPSNPILDFIQKLPIGGYSLFTKVTKNNVVSRDTIEFTINENDTTFLEILY